MKPKSEYMAAIDAIAAAGRRLDRLQNAAEIAAAIFSKEVADAMDREIAAAGAELEAAQAAFDKILGEML